MRIVSWNLNQKRAAQERLWADLRPDVALVQEIQESAIAEHGGVGRNAEGRRFGSAVLARRGLSLAEVIEAQPSGMTGPVSLHLTFPGSVAIAEVKPQGGGEPLAVVSLHALFEAGWGMRMIHQQVSDLMYLFAARFRPRTRGPTYRTVVAVQHQHAVRSALGRTRSHPLPAPRAVWLPQRTRAAAAARGRLPGCPCTDDPCPHFETWRRSRPGTKPRQNDYVFLTGDLMQALVRAEVGEIDQRYGDHAPIEVELRV